MWLRAADANVKGTGVADVLDQAEVDALLAAVEAGGLEAPAPRPPAGPTRDGKDVKIGRGHR